MEGSVPAVQGMEDCAGALWTLEGNTKRAFQYSGYWGGCAGLAPMTDDKAPRLQSALVKMLSANQKMHSRNPAVSADCPAAGKAAAMKDIQGRLVGPKPLVDRGLSPLNRFAVVELHAILFRVLAYGHIDLVVVRVLLEERDEV
eukprot:CAMPEP_0174373946 /NCGR_PEP_ID=MMETSP0811_2-20130205/109063_1 /TAXON_ID=73025 ORGANISM="Eutreptiella gymnastica-like, Strain CCMP1594" /NCGR_SAMPLE_ID=MMETSP0811_2 /ASSEMBLY_ACC=CAM_ASM_000667 /LENGTH=143 /DNA_ID=CAMNT_0015522803 /DNA_START=415 /DNA_END=848 /DNA_ORIENTATION=-